MVSRPVLLRIKGNSWIFTFWESTQTKKTKTDETKTKQLNERALDDTKTIGKTAADIFAKSGPEKP